MRCAPRSMRSTDDRRELRHGAAARAGGDGGADQRTRADLRRERHRQGAGRAQHSRDEPPAVGAVRRSELRGDSRGADRERAVRPRAWRVHRRRRRSPRQVRGRAWRHDLPRRDRRHEPEDAGQGVARAAGAGHGGGRRLDADPRGRARARRDEQGSASRDSSRPVPRGSLFPAERRADLRAAAARAHRGHPAAGRSFHGDARARVRAAAEDVRAGRA